MDLGANGSGGPSAGGGNESNTWLEFLTAISSRSLAPGQPDPGDPPAPPGSSSAGSGDPLGFLYGSAGGGGGGNVPPPSGDGSNAHKRARRERDDDGLDFDLGVDDYGNSRPSSRMLPVSPPESGGRDDGGGGRAGGAMDDATSQSGSEYASTPVDAARGSARAKRVRTQ